MSSITTPLNPLAPAFVTPKAERHYVPIDDRSPSHSSVYRALSRQIYGNPNHLDYIRSEVIDHLIWVCLNGDDRLYGTYWRYVQDFEEDFRPKQQQQQPGKSVASAASASVWPPSEGIRSFIAGLTSPDIALCPCAPKELASQTLDVIANAVRARITLSSGDGRAEITRGHKFNRECRVGFREDDRIKAPCRHTVESLVEDQSGKVVVDFLMQQRRTNRQIEIRKMCWWPKKLPSSFSSNHDFECFNEWRLGPSMNQEIPPPPPNDPRHLKGLTVFTVNVDKPHQVSPALDLLFAALERAPISNELLYDPDQVVETRRLKKYIGVDAEFTTRILTDREINIVWDKVSRIKNVNRDSAYRDVNKEHLSKGREEQLVSVLTFAVDRHLVFNFFLLHMIENATEQTSSAFRKLLRRTIFNPQLIKIWFRYAADFTVLDATIAHMFQGTLRLPYTAIRQYASDLEGLVVPSFKVRSPFLMERRPSDLDFKTWGASCVFHAQGRNDRNIPCPCPLGNIDIMALFTYIGNRLGFQYPDPLPLHVWWDKNMTRVSYPRFLYTCFQTNDLFDILVYFKDSPRQAGLSPDEFYRSIKPGMETKDRLMGYNIGDVIGLALVMRMLTQCDDRRLLAKILCNMLPITTAEINWPVDLVGSQEGAIDRNQPSKDSCRKFEPFEPRHNSNNNGIPLIDDFPKLYYRERVGLMNIDIVAAQGTVTRSERVADLFTRDATVYPQTLSYLEHDERILIEREGRAGSEEFLVTLSLKESSLKRSYPSVWDPTKIPLPEIMTEELPMKEPEPQGIYAASSEQLRGEILNQYICSQLQWNVDRPGWPLEPLGFLPGLGDLSCVDEGTAIRWGRNLSAGESLHLTQESLASPASFTYNDFQRGPLYDQWITQRRKDLHSNQSYPPRRPQRPKGEELVLRHPMENDPNRDCDIEPVSPIYDAAHKIVTANMITKPWNGPDTWRESYESRFRPTRPLKRRLLPSFKPDEQTKKRKRGFGEMMDGADSSDEDERYRKYIRLDGRSDNLHYDQPVKAPVLNKNGSGTYRPVDTSMVSPPPLSQGDENGSGTYRPVDTSMVSPPPLSQGGENGSGTYRPVDESMISPPPTKSASEQHAKEESRGEIGKFLETILCSIFGSSLKKRNRHNEASSTLPGHGPVKSPRQIRFPPTQEDMAIIRSAFKLKIQLESTAVAATATAATAAACSSSSSSGSKMDIDSTKSNADAANASKPLPPFTVPSLAIARSDQTGPYPASWWNPYPPTSTLRYGARREWEKAQKQRMEKGEGTLTSEKRKKIESERKKLREEQHLARPVVEPKLYREGDKEEADDGEMEIDDKGSN